MTIGCNLNDLLEIKLIFLAKVICCNFLNLYGRHVIRYETSLTICSLQKQQIEVRLVGSKALFIALSLCPLSFFSRTVPLNSGFTDH